MPRIRKKSKAAKRALLALRIAIFFCIALAPMDLMVVTVAHLLAHLSIVPAILLLVIAVFLTPIVLLAGDLMAIRIFKLFLKGRKAAD